MDNDKELTNFYSGKGFERRIGFGNSPPVLVIDFINAFTDDKSPLGANLDYQLYQTKKILTKARTIGLPIGLFQGQKFIQL